MKHGFRPKRTLPPYANTPLHMAYVHGSIIVARIPLGNGSTFSGPVTVRKFWLDRWGRPQYMVGVAGSHTMEWQA